MINSSSLQVLIVSLLVSIVHMSSIGGEGPPKNYYSINEMKLRFYELESQNARLQLDFLDLKNTNQKLLEEWINCTEFHEQTDYITEKLNPISNEVDLFQTLVREMWPKKNDDEVKLIEKLSKDNESVNLTAVATEVNRMAQSIQTFLQKFQTFDVDMNRKLSNAQRVVVDTIQSLHSKKSFMYIGSKYYYIENEEKLNWFAAALKCRSLGGNLVNIESAEEFDLLIKHLDATRYWTSGNDLANEGKYFSVTTGEPMRYTRWNDAQPDNADNNEDCIEIYKYLPYKMNDYGCEAKFNFICEANL